MDERTFTKQEADTLLADLTQRLVRIREARHVVFANADRVKDSAASNGGGKPGAAYWQALSTLRREVEAIGAEGVLLRDADSGLVDFPAERDGEPVFLCWRLGEPAVEHWHSRDTGFAGRRRL